MLAEGDPDGRMAELTRQLDEIEPDERAAIDELVEEAKASGDERRGRGHRRRGHRAPHGPRPPARRPGRPHQLAPALRLRLLRGARALRGTGRGAAPRDGRHLLRGRVRRALQHGSRADGPHARRLRRPQQDARAARGGEELDPSFEEFMAQYGDMFPGNPRGSTSCSSSWPSAWRRPRPCGTRSAPSSRPSCAPDGGGARGHGPALAGGPAGRNLQRAVPDAGWQRSYDFNGEGPMGMNRATDLATQLGQLDRMEEVIQSASNPAALGEIDLDQVRAAHGRGRGPRPRPAGQPDQVAGRRRPHRAVGRADRADAPRRAPPGPEGAGRPLRPDQQGPHRGPQRRAHRHRGTTARRRPRPTSTATR